MLYPIHYCGQILGLPLSWVIKVRFTELDYNNRKFKQKGLMTFEQFKETP